MSYGEYLTARLCSHYLWDRKEYDFEFRDARIIYEAFRESEFDDVNEGLYECLEKFILYLKDIKLNNPNKISNKLLECL